MDKKTKNQNQKQLVLLFKNKGFTKQKIIPLLICFLSLYSTEIHAQKTFFKEFYSSSSCREPRALETGVNSYFTIQSDYAMPKFDPVSSGNSYTTTPTTIKRYNLNGDIEKSKTFSLSTLSLDLAYTNENTNDYIYMLGSGDVFTTQKPTITKINANNDNFFGTWVFKKVYYSLQNSIPQSQKYNAQSIIPYRSDFTKKHNTTDEGCIFAVMASQLDIETDATTDRHDYLIVTRIDKNGDVLWENHIKITSLASNRTRIIQNQQGTYVLYNVKDQNGNAGSDVSLIAKLDNNTGALINNAVIGIPYTVEEEFQFYDIASNNDKILVCGRIKQNGRTDNDGIVFQISSDLNTVGWQKTFQNPNNDEIFFRIINNGENEFTLGGYFIPNGLQETTISSTRILDLGINSTILSENYLALNNTYTNGSIDVIDMESNLTCGPIFLASNNSQFYGGNSNVLVRCDKNFFQCNNLVKNSTIISNLSFSLFAVETFSNPVMNDVMDAYPAIQADNEMNTLCDNCVLQSAPLFNISVKGKGIIPNACEGDILVAPACYAYYEWLKNGVVVATTFDNEFKADIADGYQVVCYNSETCFWFSDFINVRPMPKPDFTFNDNCIGNISIFTNTTPLTPPINNTIWKFGDGTTSNSITQSNHTYASSGIYNVTLEVTSNYGCIAQKVKPISIFSLPVVNFNEAKMQNQGYPAVCKTNVSNWIDQTTVGMGQTINTWDWYFDDNSQNTSYTQQNPSFNFTEKKVHKIKLTATSNKGCMNNLEKNFTVYTPTVNFTQSGLCNNANVTLTTNSSTPFGTLQNYEWWYNNILQSTNNPYVIAGLNTGSYNYKHKVTDIYGCKEEITKAVIVNNKPTVSFTNTDVCENKLMPFYGNASSGVAITNWNWTFGDGTTGVNQNINHFYSTYGVFNPTLTVTDANGCVNSFTKAVNVFQAPAVPVISSSPNRHVACEGEVFTLVASNYNTSHTLQWTLNGAIISGANSNTYTYTAPYVNANDVIGLKVTSPNGCETLAFPYSIQTDILDVFITTVQTNLNLCAGSFITIGGHPNSPPQSYQWQVSTDNGTTWSNIGTNTYTYNATSAGWYRYVASNASGCSKNSSVVVINNAAPLSIVDNLQIPNQIYPTANPFALQLNSVNAPNYSNITWYRNDVPISNNINIPLLLPGNYYAIASGCGIEKSNIDVINYNQSNMSWNVNTYSSGYTLNGGAASIISLPNTGYVVGGDIVVTNGGSLTIEGVLNFSGCNRIRVNAGCSLTITNNSIISATNQWQGIIVDGAGTVIINNNSDISNAVVGVMSLNGGRLTVQNSKFGRNVCHIAINGYNQIAAMNISNNTFGHVIDANTSVVCTYTEYSNLSIPRGVQVYINGVTGVHPINIQSNNAWLTQQYSGNNSIFVKASNQNNLTMTMNTIQGFYNNALSFTNCNNLTNNLNTVKRLDNVQYTYALASPAGSGIIYKDVDIAAIQGNEIQNWKYGVEYYENLNSTNTTDFSDNKLRNNDVGLVVAPVRNPINYSGTDNTIFWSNEIRLATSCNLFKGNNNGIIGSGKWIAQGTSTLSCGNRFKDGVLLNSVHSILWNWSGLTPQYNHNNSDDNPASNSGVTNVNIDGANINNNFGGGNKLNQYTFANLNSCTSILNGPLLSLKTSSLNSSLLVYPNPTNALINIMGLKGNSSINVMGVDGKLLLILTGANETEAIDLINFPDGIYLIKVTDENGTSNHKVIKLNN